eukprot:TRINITY_DN1943_c0_g1_i1.p1 TRINITY_DN1943_c0_g1~~TRINITY_DN1943_c0_g1_i1.p1  ORF type:complete len:489 (-),score=24.27 TRINITY_DN1943_c0_g1_i1:1433-2740(-)
MGKQRSLQSQSSSLGWVYTSKPKATCKKRSKNNKGHQSRDAQIQERISWTPEFKQIFNEAVYRLGGLKKAKPTKIRVYMMGLNLCVKHIKSHLQYERRKANVKIATTNLSNAESKEEQNEEEEPDEEFQNYVIQDLHDSDSDSLAEVISESLQESFNEEWWSMLQGTNNSCSSFEAMDSLEVPQEVAEYVLLDFELSENSENNTSTNDNNYVHNNNNRIHINLLDNVTNSQQQILTDFTHSSQLSASSSGTVLSDKQSESYTPSNQPQNLLQYMSNAQQQIQKDFTHSSQLSASSSGTVLSDKQSESYTPSNQPQNIFQNNTPINYFNQPVSTSSQIGRNNIYNYREYQQFNNFNQPLPAQFNQNNQNNQYFWHANKYDYHNQQNNLVPVDCYDGIARGQYINQNMKQVQLHQYYQYQQQQNANFAYVQQYGNYT